MSLIKRSRYSIPSVPGLFDDLFTRELFNWSNTNYSSTSTTIPSINIRETKDAYLVELAAPGMDKQDFKITLNGNLLTVSSVKENNTEDNQEGYIRREFSYESFCRTLEFPKNVVDEENISAQYENGLLQLSVPKREEAKNRGPKMIEIA